VAKELSIVVNNSSILECASFFDYVIFKTSHILIKAINGKEVTKEMVEKAERIFGRWITFTFFQKLNITLAGTLKQLGPSKPNVMDYHNSEYYDDRDSRRTDTRMKGEVSTKSKVASNNCELYISILLSPAAY
jgi:hypothetical protein